MKLSVIVPVKGGDQKSRLAGVLSRSEREELTRLMLSHVLSVVTEAGLATDSCCVTSSGSMASEAARLGFRVVSEERDRGVDSAVATAVDSLPGSDSFMVLPCDLPLLQPGELAGAASVQEAGADVVIAPSAKFDGTNLLLFKRDPRIALSYDRDSFWNHLSSAAGKGLRVAVLASDGLTMDLDSKEDVERMVAARINTAPVEFLRKATRNP
jgi:2-phospho-L-lactate guanylyltransferase